MIEAPALRIVPAEATQPWIQTRAGEFYIKKLDREDRLSRDIFPEFVDRAVKFVSLYNAPTDPNALSQWLWASFQARSDDALLLAALDKKHEIAAHAILRMDMIGPDPYGFVLQVEKLFSAPEIMEEGEKIVEAWRKRKSLKGTANMALNEKVMRVWRRRGFKIRGYLMTRDMERKE